MIEIKKTCGKIYKELWFFCCFGLFGYMLVDNSIYIIVIFTKWCSWKLLSPRAFAYLKTHIHISSCHWDFLKSYVGFRTTPIWDNGKMVSWPTPGPANTTYHLGTRNYAFLPIVCSVSSKRKRYHNLKQKHSRFALRFRSQDGDVACFAMGVLLGNCRSKTCGLDSGDILGVGSIDETWHWKETNKMWIAIVRNMCFAAVYTWYKLGLVRRIIHETIIPQSQ